MDPDNIKMLRQNVRGYKVDIVQGALWGSHSYVTIDKTDQKSFGFKVTEASPKTPGALHTVTIHDLLARMGVKDLGLLKLDIEGAEENLFTAGDESWIDCIRTLIIETHGQKAKAAVLSVMTKHNFLMNQQGEKLVFTRNRPKSKFL